MSDRHRLESDQQTINGPQAGTFLLGMVLMASAFLALFVAMLSASIGNGDHSQMREFGSKTLAIGMPLLVVMTIAMRFRRHRLLYLVSAFSWMSMATIALIIARDSGHAVATSAVLWILFVGLLILVVQALVYLRSNQPYPLARTPHPRRQADSYPVPTMFPTLPLDPAMSLQKRVDAESGEDGDTNGRNDQSDSGSESGVSGADPVASPESSSWGISGDNGGWGWSGSDTGSAFGGDSGGSSGSDSGSSNST